jgi:hypothetical protein
MGHIFMFAGDVELRFKEHDAYLHNTAYNTLPLVVHGNGPSKLVLNTLGNYLASSWNPEDGCLSCWDDSVFLEDKNVSALLDILLETSQWQENYRIKVMVMLEFLTVQILS